jgi:hypothetical protein
MSRTIDNRDYINDGYNEGFDLDEDDSQMGSGDLVTPVRRSIGYPLLAKRHRPMCEPNYNPYPLVPSREVQNASHGDFGWYEHDGQILFLIESQTKMMGMVEKISERIASVEKAVSDASPSSGSFASPEEKKRIPKQCQFLNS